VLSWLSFLYKGKESFAEDSSVALMLVLLFTVPIEFLVSIQADSGICEESVCHFDVASAKNFEFRLKPKSWCGSGEGTIVCIQALAKTPKNPFDGSKFLFLF
jgi:hypothetical protein